MIAVTFSTFVNVYVQCSGSVIKFVFADFGMNRRRARDRVIESMFCSTECIPAPPKVCVGSLSLWNLGISAGYSHGSFPEQCELHLGVCLFEVFTPSTVQSSLPCLALCGFKREETVMPVMVCVSTLPQFRSNTQDEVIIAI